MLRFLIATLFFCWFSPLNAQPPDVNQMEEARELFNEGIRQGLYDDFDSAFDYFSQAIEKNPIYAEAYLYRGLARIELKEFPAAIRDLTIAIELDPAFSDQAHYFRGVARYEKSEYLEALDDLSVAIRINPDFVAYYQRGKVHMRLENYQSAVHDFDIALRLNPEFYEAWLYRGLAFYYLGDHDAAKRDMDYGRQYLTEHPVIKHYDEILSGSDRSDVAYSTKQKSSGREIDIAGYFNKSENDSTVSENHQNETDESDTAETFSQHSEKNEINPETENTSPAKDPEQLGTGFYNHFLQNVSPSGFGVQVASYSGTTNLTGLAMAYQEKYEVPVFIHISKNNGRTLYRLILGTFPEREEAESFRDKLRTGDFPDSFLAIFANM
ncbi:MAG: tetratricopeptide repeat protein [Bacteroidales bacterium]